MIIFRIKNNAKVIVFFYPQSDFFNFIFINVKCIVTLQQCVVDFSELDQIQSLGQMLNWPVIQQQT